MSVVFAHTISTSRSELKVEDGLTRLTVRMPIFELDHLPQADRQLAKHFRVAGDGPVSESCRNEGNEWICRATFLGTPGTIDCRLAEVTVPNHVHTLKFGDRTLVFTAAVTRLSGEQPDTWPLWIFAALITLLIAWTIRSLRSRRKT